MPSILRVRRLQGNEYADIVSVRRQGELFVAICRDEQQREATATHADQSLAIIIESNNRAIYRIPTKDAKQEAATPSWITYGLNFKFQIPPRIAYSHLFEPKWITREERDNDGT